MSAPEWTPVPPVICAPWCEFADGHPRDICIEDQQCWGPSAYVQVTRNRDLDVGDNDQRIGVMAYRQPGHEPCVYVHLDGIHIAPRRDQILDDQVHLTALEAFDLATALMDTVRTLTGEPKGNRPILRGIMVPPQSAGCFADQIESREPTV